MGFAALLIIVLLARPFDLVLVGLHVPLVICSAAILAVVLTGAVRELNTKTGRMVAAFVLWTIIASPFGIWKGGSLRYVENFVFLLLVLFLALAGGPKNLMGVRRLMLVLGVSVSFAVCALSVLARVSNHDTPNVPGDYRAGGAGMFGNEGEFALLIGFVLPFWVYTALTVKNTVFRMILMSGSLYLLWLLVMTGTRSGLFAMVPVFVLLLMRVTMIQRFALVGAALIVCTLIVLSAPERILQRLASVTASEEDHSELGQEDAGPSEAVASAVQRKELFWDALQTMASNPIFGVGPGNFGDYRYNVLGIAAGKRKRWFPAHNTYMQIGAESGVMGLILYVALILSVFAAIRDVRKRCVPGNPEWKLVNQMALCLQFSLLFYAVMCAFQNCDRYPHLFVIAGFATALDRLTRSVSPRAELPFSPLVAGSAFGTFGGSRAGARGAAYQR